VKGSRGIIRQPGNDVSANLREMVSIFFVPGCTHVSSLPVTTTGGSFAPACRRGIPKRPHVASRSANQRVRMASSDPRPTTESPEEAKTPFDLPNTPDDPTRNDGRATAGLFGIRIQTNGDVIKFGFVAVAIAYAFKYSLTLFGVRDLLAGQITTGFVSVASLLAWVST
jgi:hypothetical protein